MSERSGWKNADTTNSGGRNVDASVVLARYKQLKDLVRQEYCDIIVQVPFLVIFVVVSILASCCFRVFLKIVSELFRIRTF